MNFDPSGDTRETVNSMSTVRGLDMLADVAVARQQREKEGDSDAAGIREYQATMHWRGLVRPHAELRKIGTSVEDAIEL